ncbi:MAG TPA: VWA domain-containing protein [Candidatus Dormibacteraeota bacterium]|jgi:VWFA-related protein|nr:VWA domain-containing protein [Candidatus Dormibacteraeota bacterium]
MRQAITALLLAFILLALPISESAQQQQQPPPVPNQQETQQSQTTIKVPVNVVDVLATVLNRRNKLVPDLTQDDFKLLDENTPQTIRFFSRQSDIPLRIGLLMDTSNSIRDRLKFEQDAAVNFLYTVLRRGKDQSFAMTFDDEPQIIQGFTGDTGLLRDQIVKTRAGGGTAVYDAIYEACAKHLSNPPRPPGDQPDIVRRVMILISDGEDNLSDHTRAEAVEMAQRTGVVIYTISTSIQWVTTTAEKDCRATGTCKYHLTDGDKILQDLAEETGGRSFYPYHVDDLDQSFQDIGDELRNQYQITYNPSNFVPNGKYHRIKLEVPKFGGYQVRARRGYYARPNGVGPVNIPATNPPPAAAPQPPK